MSLRSHLSRLLRTQVHSVRKKSVHSVAVIGAPFSQGQKRKGVEYGPAAVREAGLMKRLSDLGCHLKDFGDLNFTPVPKDDLYNNLIVNPRSVGLANQELAEVVSRAVSGGYSCVTVGGDHRNIKLCSHVLSSLRNINWHEKSFRWTSFPLLRIRAAYILPTMDFFLGYLTM